MNYRRQRNTTQQREQWYRRRACFRWL